MIRDAYHGIIDLPSNVCWNEPPTDALTWELSRLVSIDGDPRMGRRILDASNDYLMALGALRCLFLAGPAFMRMARLYGYDPEPVGDVVSNRSGEFLAFSCATRNRKVK